MILSFLFFSGTLYVNVETSSMVKSYFIWINISIHQKESWLIQSCFSIYLVKILSFVQSLGGWRQGSKTKNAEVCK